MARPTSAVIHTDALRHNLGQVRARAPNSRVMAVVKADGYGHGLERVARALGGADAFGVAALSDAERLRAIPVFASLPEETLKEVVRCTRDGITINTFMLERSRYLSEFVDLIEARIPIEVQSATLALWVARLDKIFKKPLRRREGSTGRRAVVIGRSNIVGKPIAQLLMRKGRGGDATVCVCHSRSKNLPEIVKQADIVVAAIGMPSTDASDQPSSAHDSPTISPLPIMCIPSAAGAFVVLVVMNFAWFWPIYTGEMISTPDWLDRIWFKQWI